MSQVALSGGSRLATLTKDELVAKARRLMARASAISQKAEQGIEVAKMSGVGTLPAGLAGALNKYQPNVPLVDNVPLAPALALLAYGAAAFGSSKQTAYLTCAGIGLSSPFIAAQVEAALP